MNKKHKNKGPFLVTEEFYQLLKEFFCHKDQSYLTLTGFKKKENSLFDIKDEFEYDQKQEEYYEQKLPQQDIEKHCGSHKKQELIECCVCFDLFEHYEVRNFKCGRHQGCFDCLEIKFNSGLCPMKCKRKTRFF